MAYKINGTTVIDNSGELQNVSAVSGPMKINDMPVLQDPYNYPLHIKAGWELYDSKTITNNGSSARASFEAPLPGYYEKYNNNIAGSYDLIHIDVLYFRGDETASNKGFPGFQLGSNTSSWYSNQYENKGFDYKLSGLSQGFANTPNSGSPASYGYIYRSSGYGDLYPTGHEFISWSHTIYNANNFFHAPIVHTRACAIGANGNNYISEYWTTPRFTAGIYAIRWREDPNATVSGNNLSLSYNMYIPKSRYHEDAI
tara:strand:+ start:4077 stop:4844 length:768 start_codon:yes stop_codon:yes gene_type:complete